MTEIVIKKRRGRPPSKSLDEHIAEKFPTLASPDITDYSLPSQRAFAIVPEPHQGMELHKVVMYVIQGNQVIEKRDMTTADTKMIAMHRLHIFLNKLNLQDRPLGEINAAL